MTIDLTAAPWPAEPAPTATIRKRQAWYTAVARWAPSKHNSQPWQFTVRESCLEVSLDTSRLLYASDPMWREAIIACGAAVHLVQVAARALGHETAVIVLPDGDVSILARITESGDHPVTQQDRARLAAIATRRTDRGPLDAGVLSPSLPFLLQRAAFKEHAALRLVSTAGDRRTLSTLVDRADRLSARDGQADAELTHWLREPGDLRDDGVSTSSTRGPLSSHRAEFVQRDFSSATSQPDHDRAGTDDPIVCVLSTDADRPADWLTAGQALAAVLLRATMEGAQASYLNQPIEQPPLRHQLQEDLALPGPPQLVLRLGAGGVVRTPPRRACELVDAPA